MRATLFFAVYSCLFGLGASIDEKEISEKKRGLRNGVQSINDEGVEEDERQPSSRELLKGSFTQVKGGKRLPSDGLTSLNFLASGSGVPAPPTKAPTTNPIIPIIPQLVGQIVPEEMRFNKVIFPDGDIPEEYASLFPLSNASYPVSGDVTKALRNSRAVSVVDPADPNEAELYYDIDEVISKVGGFPSHPSSDSSSIFWEYFEEVVDAQIERMANPNRPASDLMPSLPDRWLTFTADQAAQEVRAEYPGFHQAVYIEDLLRGVYGPIEVDTNIIPSRGITAFLRKHVMLADLNTWAVAFVGPHNFGAKWRAGRARPEEVAHAIKTGILTQGVPPRIVTKIASMNFETPEEFTAYPEGCPRHPSWPAMHSAASSVSFWLRVILNLTPVQACQAKKVDFAVAYGRTVAGVHYHDDNMAGLAMGQYIMASYLPEYLEFKYGSNRTAVAEKVEKMGFSWGDLDREDLCPELRNSESER